MVDNNPDFQVVELGPKEGWKEFGFKHPLLEVTARGKKFLKSDLGLTGMELSINSLGPHRAVPFFHRHQQNEELYFFLEGQGEFRADDTVIPLRSGTAIRVAPSVNRSWRNTGGTPLYYLVIQAKAGSFDSDGISDGVPVEGDPWRPISPTP